MDKLNKEEIGDTDGTLDFCQLANYALPEGLNVENRE